MGDSSFDVDCEDQCDLGFAFNNSNFSDRVLRIYIFSESSAVVRVKSLYISSSILAARSPFFYKLFSNGMRESHQCHATLRINALEEVGLMEVLKFMYINKLQLVTSTPDLVLDVLVIADKYEVVSCIRYCSRLLRITPQLVQVCDKESGMIFTMLDPRMQLLQVMDSPADQGRHCDLAFAFNDNNFSDRLLHVYIFSDSTHSLPSASAVIRVKTLYITSSILAAKSSFFYKLFSDSDQYHANLRINASEEAALLELLKFMYSNKLTVKTALDVLHVLLLAHKFDVPSCTRQCTRLLKNLPMTPESVLVYLDLPSTLIMAEAFHSLTLAAKHFYAIHYKDITKFPDAVLSLPLASVKAILASDDLQVSSEDEVYWFFLKWAQAQYPNIKERREIITTNLSRLIRHPYLTHGELQKFIHNHGFKYPLASLIKYQSSMFKLNILTARNMNMKNPHFVARAYKYLPVRAIEYKNGSPGLANKQLTYPEVIVYMDIKRDVCARGMVCSEAFSLDDRRFHLVVTCNMEQESFTLFLAMQEHKSSSSIFSWFAYYYYRFYVFDYYFYTRLGPRLKFKTESYGYKMKFKGRYASTNLKTTVVYLYLSEIPWTTFNDTKDGLLRLKVCICRRR